MHTHDCSMQHTTVIKLSNAYSPLWVDSVPLPALMLDHCVLLLVLGSFFRLSTSAPGLARARSPCGVFTRALLSQSAGAVAYIIYAARLSAFRYHRAHMPTRARKSRRTPTPTGSSTRVKQQNVRQPICLSTSAALLGPYASVRTTSAVLHSAQDITPPPMRSCSPPHSEHGEPDGCEARCEAGCHQRRTALSGGPPLSDRAQTAQPI